MLDESFDERLDLLLQGVLKEVAESDRILGQEGGFSL
jgi:hypothetical protein